MPGTKMMGYQKGGDVKKKDKKKKVKAPGKTRTAKGKSLEELGMKASGPSKNPAKASMPTAKNNTMPPVPKPQAPAGAMGGMPPKPPMGGMGGAMGGAPKPPMGGMGGAPKPPMGGAPGGMGMPPKPPMPMMKKGGKVKKKAKTYKSGGNVRGAGIAKQGVKECKMR